MVMLFVLLFPSMQTTNSLFLLPALALIGSGAAAILIYALSYKKGEGISPTRLLLSGIGVAAGISAAMIIMTLKLTPESYTFVANWLAGSIWGSNWKFVMALLPWLIVLLPFVYYKANVMNVLNLGIRPHRGWVHLSKRNVFSFWLLRLDWPVLVFRLVAVSALSVWWLHIWRESWWARSIKCCW